jgi:hypothetical protein
MQVIEVSETGVRWPLERASIFLRTLDRTAAGHMVKKDCNIKGITLSGQVSDCVRPYPNVRCPSVGGFLEPHTPDTSDRQAAKEAKMSQAETDRLIHYMPILVRDGGVSDWEREFCASIIARSRRAGFTPSAKQIGVMSRMVDAFQQRQLAGDVLDDERAEV